MLLVWRAFTIGYLADRVRHRFASLLAYGIGLTIAIQALVNIGVTTGLLPTKGLTLPLVSYGGSSVVIVCVSLGISCGLLAHTGVRRRREIRQNVLALAQEHILGAAQAHALNAAVDGVAGVVGGVRVGGS